MPHQTPTKVPSVTQRGFEFDPFQFTLTGQDVPQATPRVFDSEQPQFKLSPQEMEDALSIFTAAPTPEQQKEMEEALFQELKDKYPSVDVDSLIEVGNLLGSSLEMIGEAAAMESLSARAEAGQLLGNEIEIHQKAVKGESTFADADEIIARQQSAERLELPLKERLKEDILGVNPINREIFSARRAVFEPRRRRRAEAEEAKLKELPKLEFAFYHSAHLSGELP